MRITAGILIVLTFSCGHSKSTLPQRFTHKDLTKTLSEKLLLEIQAPQIVLGTVTGVRKIGVPVRSTQVPQIALQQVSVSIQVEKVFRGVSSSSLRFSYYEFSQTGDDSPGAQKVYHPKVSDRRIYFLVPDDTGYRSAGDVLDYSIPVYADPSAVSEPCPTQDNTAVGCCISAILLSTRRLTGRSSFGQLELSYASELASTLCSRRRALELLSKISQEGDPQSVEYARELLSAARADGELIP